MNEHTQPMNNPIEPRQMTETPRDIDNQRLHLDAFGVEPRAVTAAAEQIGGMVQDAVKTDASRRALEEKLSSVRSRGVEWVRASDLIARGTGRVAGVGIRLHRAVGTQTRRGLASGVGAVSRRVRELPPVSAFGRRGTSSMAAARPEVGMR
ncbi:hypothetical protein [Bifidobacterium psychraerophilum]|uniref:Uncharacterized protein n=1 Tax=Bifidobacterium psychraerophilum TaxID=218140 RepID=A0A087CF78_9BIFI|nr:hypothetical protein [Bifidobacterium psychraerophilum]KFI81928.1 hypothetical protein BPSY_0776 [Bifidobacterium psychraerophilum]PKA94734.1 hypothetical protein A9A89_0959 [Bifidobacterium psychraerophilum DSM 22366]